MFTRRRFITSLASAVAATMADAAASSRTQHAPPLLTSGQAVGDVTAHEAIVWARADREALLRVEYGTDPDLRDSRVTDPIALAAEGDFTATASLEALVPSARYFYRIHLQDPIASWLISSGPTSTFLTAPDEEEEAPVTFAYSGDAGEAYQPFRLLDAVRAHRVDFFLFLGDTIYADHGAVARTLDEYRAKYRANRRDAALQRLLRETSVYVMWDDHEIANNSNRTHPRLPIARRAFMDYWPIRPDASDGARLYRSFRWGRWVELFLLDCRQYRSPQSERDGPEKTMLGAAQKAWLKDALLASPAHFKFIAATVPLKYHTRDSWAGYATERQELLDFLRVSGLSRVIFLAADVHYAAVIAHAEGVKEIIAGPIAQLPSPIAFVRGRPGVEFAAAGMYTFARIRVFAEAGRPQAEISLFNASNTHLYTTRVM